MTQGVQIQNSFVSGEISPSMWGQTKHPKYQSGASTFRNGFVNFQGGYSSRAGTTYIGMCKQNAPNNGGVSITNAPPRDIPFQFSITDTFALEFGDYYMRIKFHGGYVTEGNKNITAITQANPGVFTIASHGYSNGDWVYIASVTGMIEFNGLTWIVQNVTTDTFTLTDLFGNTADTTSFLAYISGGTAARIYTVVSPYLAEDLPFLKFTQSADVFFLACWNQDTLTEYPPYQLTRTSNTNWTFTEINYASSIGAPTNVAVTAQSSTGLNTWYTYVVTAIDASGDESIASQQVQVHNNNIAINAGSNTITWKQVSGASSYNVYSSAPYYDTSSTSKLQIGVPFGFLGSAIGTSFIDNNIVADYTVTPPVNNNPFAQGAIQFVSVTAGGSGLTQATANFTITTSTGSGFEGTPIISSTGNLTGFLITNGGENYANGDTISIVTGGTQATGTFTGTGSNPGDGNTVVLNGVTWTFKTTPTLPPETKIQSTVTASFQQLAADLTASGNSLLTAAIYSVSSTNTLNITYAEIGTAGNAYALSTGSYGGSISASTLTGGTNGAASNATAVLQIGPATGTFPGVVAFFQQRLVYASTEDNPDTYYMSNTGNFTNMNASIPSVDTDAIIGTPWSQQVNGIQFMTPMPGGLLMFTGAGAWQLNGGNAIAVTPADQNVQPQSRYGCSATIPPIPINFHVLYVRENNGVVYDLVYNFWSNIYIGNDLTIYSNHLFNSYILEQWAYAEKPYKLVWVVRNDGTMLSLTYSAEQQEEGWARHDTNGLYVGICSIEEPPVDAVYSIAQRFVDNQWVYYSERFDNRIWTNPENCLCVDCALVYPMRFPDVSITFGPCVGEAWSL